MDGKDSSFSSSERAIMCHTNPTPYREYILLQDTLTSAYKAGSRARNVANPCMTTYLSTKLYDFLAHPATYSRACLQTLNISVFGMEESERYVLYSSPKSARSLSSCSLDRLVWMISYCWPLRASATRSTTAPLVSKNKAEVPGVILERTCSMKSSLIP